MSKIYRRQKSKNYFKQRWYTIFIFLMLTLTILPTISAWDWDNFKTYNNEEEKITIKNSLDLLPFYEDKLAEYTLNYNTEQCFNCWAEGEAILYKYGKLFSDVNFKERVYGLKEINGQKILIEVEEIREVIVEDKEKKNCKEVELYKGYFQEYCDYEVVGTHKEYITEKRWKEYYFTDLKEGKYRWRIEGKIKPGEHVDWIISSFGKDLTEWAWFNNDWDKRRNLTLNSTVDTENEMLENINVTGLTLDTDSCDELRVTNSSGDEIPYNVTDDTGKAEGDGLDWCVIRITHNSLVANTAVNYSVYYDNPSATKPSYNRRGGEHYIDGNSLQIMRLNDANAFFGINAGTSGTPQFISGNGKFDNAINISTNNDGLYWDPSSYSDTNISAGTVEFWYNHTTTGGDTYLFDNTDPRIALFYTSGDFHFFTNIADATIAYTLTNGQLYHIALTWNLGENVKRMYVDGVRIINASFGLDPPQSYGAGNSTLGRRHATEGGDFVSKWGGYDELMISNIYKNSFIGKNVTYSIGNEEESPSIFEVTLNSPVDEFNSTSSLITFNCSAVSDTGVLNITLILNDIENETITNSTPNQNLSFQSIKGLSDGSHTWKCNGCEVSSCVNSSERTVNIDTINPAISIISPSGQIDSHVFGNNLSLNWSINDTNLDSCWFDYNGANTTLTCSDNSTNFIPVVNEQSLIVWANDSFGRINFDTTNWTYAFVENNATFNASTQETASESFTLNLTTDLTILSITSNLNYNGTNYLSTSSCTGTECLLSNTIDVSLVTTGESELHNFFWNFTIFNGSDSIETISSTRSQNVSKIHLEECNATWATDTLNFTVYDEQNLTRISPFQFDGSFDFWIGSGTVSRNISFSKNDTEMNLCLDPNVTMKIEATINYDEEVNKTSIYTDRFYYFDDYEIDNVLQHIRMYLLRSSESTSFILNVQDENLLPVADALIEIHRFYPGENDFRIVQISKTDDNGKSIGFFETETVDYKFIIKKDGETLLETGQQKVVPETSPFTLTFNTGEDLGEPWASQDDIPNLQSSLSWDPDTEIVTYTYVDNSTTFEQARLLVQRTSLTNSTAYTTICNETSTLTSASITCTVGNTTGFYIASSFITRSAEALDLQINFQIEDFSSVAGLLGLFFGWFLILIAAFMFKFNEIAGIWVTTLTIFLVNIIGLIKFGAVFVSAIIGVAIILTWVMER